MRISLPFAALAVTMLLTGACRDKPPQELVERACNHQMSVPFWKSWEDTLKKKGIPKQEYEKLRPEAAKEWEQQLASGEGKQIFDKCVSLYSRLSKEQLECVAGADSSKAIQACLPQPRK